MALVGKSRGGARDGERNLGIAQVALRALDSLSQHVLVGGIARALFEKLAKVVGTHSRHLSKFVQSQVPREILIHELHNPVEPNRRHSSLNGRCRSSDSGRMAANQVVSEGDGQRLPVEWPRRGAVLEIGMKRQNQRLNMTVSKVPLRDQIQVVQMSRLFHRSCKEAWLHDEHDSTGRAGPREAVTGASGQHVNRTGAVVRHAGLSADRPFGGDVALDQEVDEVGGVFVIGNRDRRHVAERFHCNSVPARLSAGKGRKRRKWANGATIPHYLDCFDGKNSTGVHRCSTLRIAFRIPFLSGPVFWTKQSEELTKAGTFYHAGRRTVNV